MLVVAQQTLFCMFVYYIHMLFIICDSSCSGLVTHQFPYNWIGKNAAIYRHVHTCIVLIVVSVGAVKRLHDKMHFASHTP